MLLKATFALFRLAQVIASGPVPSSSYGPLPLYRKKPASPPLPAIRSGTARRAQQLAAVPSRRSGESVGHRRAIARPRQGQHQHVAGSTTLASTPQSTRAAVA
jgi:hypothetical protein